MFAHRPEGHEEVSYKSIRGRVFETEGTVGAKALRQDSVWQV